MYEHCRITGLESLNAMPFATSTAAPVCANRDAIEVLHIGLKVYGSIHVRAPLAFRLQPNSVRCKSLNYSFITGQNEREETTQNTKSIRSKQLRNMYNCYMHAC